MTAINVLARFAVALFAAVYLLVPGHLRAQSVTTSAVAGTVSGPDGAPAPGMQVTITHTQTGNTAGTLTSSDGRYRILGLQPGGPYVLTVQGLGFETQQRANLNLTLSQTARFDFSLRTQAVELAALEVTADRNGVLSKSHTGASTTISDSSVSRLPSLTRDFTDFTRLTPQISTSSGGSSAGGRGNRFNNILIDGAVNNDLFGLASSSGVPGGATGARAITLEAIDQFQVQIAPYDIRQGGFTGASINAVTKSGTNDFRGSITYFMRNEGLIGKYQLATGDPSAPAGEFDQYDAGFSVGGPVLRDRLHFFVAAELSSRGAPNSGVAIGRDAQITVAEAQEVSSILQRYGYDAGEIGEIKLERGSTNVFGRLDFRINDNNRLTVRHNLVDADADELFRSNASYQLGNTRFQNADKTNSSVAQLNSVFGGKYFNELRVGFSTIRDKRDPGAKFPFVAVTLPAGPGGNRAINAGAENFSVANTLDQNVLEFTNDFSFGTGQHNFTIGTHNEFFSFANLFARNLYGSYIFDSPALFSAGTPSRFESSYLLPGGNAKAEFDVRQLSVYAQDQWDVLENVTLIAGVRYDVTLLPGNPGFNQAVETAFNRRTDEVPTGNGLINPRIGFNWDVTGDRALQLRGGTGLFAGRMPYVWVSNAYGNTGLDYVRFTCTTAASSPAFVADPDNQPRNCRGTTTAAPNEINTISPDFKFPQVWRTSLGIDRRLPFGIIGTLEGMYTKTLNDVLYRELTLTAPEATPIENRPRYTRSLAGFSNVTDVQNTSADTACSGGCNYTYNVTVQLQRAFANRFEFGAAYSFTRAKDVTSTISSQASSSWRRNAINADPNNPALRPSNFEIPHRLLAHGSFRVELLRRAPTDLSFIFVGESGKPFSYTYNGDVNNDGSTENDLIDVPGDQSQIRFAPVAANQPITPQQSWDNLNAFIESVGCLRAARGRVMERNECREPWVNRVDVRVAQSLPTLRGQNIELTLDIFNFGNLLNRKWGQARALNTDRALDPLLRIASTTAVNGRVQMGAFGAGRAEFPVTDLASRYQIQLGARYAF